MVRRPFGLVNDFDLIIHAVGPVYDKHGDKPTLKRELDDAYRWV